MKLKLDFDFPPLPSNLKHGDKITLIGSCFSDSMAEHFFNSGFEVSSNPFGTLFHPIAIANTISASLTNSTDVNVLQRDDVFFSWDSGSKIHAYSEKELKSKVIEARNSLKNQLKDTKLLVVTFGTSWGYRNLDLNQIVGNCHKQPSNLFEKELTLLDEMSKAWVDVFKDIKAINNSIEIVCTVSPVRHKKDGLVENNRSKARLIELCHHLSGSNVSYFPSYEILIDELRDYRFYTTDLVHPNETAVRYVWDRFKYFAFDDNTLALIDEIEKVKMLMNHRSLHPESQVDKDRIKKGEDLKHNLSESHPEIYWK